MTFNFLNDNLIKEFRDKANECIVFRNTYQDINGRNKWNIICSAMDWISVTARGIKSIEINQPSMFKSDDYQSLVLMQYIVAIDVLVESIIQLYRVIYGSDNLYPLKNDNTIFSKAISDDLYFKHLRAAFSTHPINLKSLDGSDAYPDERFYASWSSMSTFGDNDFSVYLYSNKPDRKEMYELGVNFSEINDYCKMRYDLLSNLKYKIEELNTEITSALRSIKIPKGKNRLNYVHTLIDENNKRIGRTYGHSYDLTYIYNMLIAHKEFADNDQKVDDYITFISNQIDKISNSIQDMSFSYQFIKPHTICGYEIDKIYMFLDKGHPLGEKYFRTLINVCFLPKLLLSIQNKNILLLFFDAYIFYENIKINKPVDIKVLLKK